MRMTSPSHHWLHSRLAQTWEKQSSYKSQQGCTDGIQWNQKPPICQECVPHTFTQHTTKAAQQ